MIGTFTQRKMENEPLTKEEYKTLETLLGKLQLHLGGLYFIMPESPMDGCHILTYVYDKEQNKWVSEFDTIHATIELTVDQIMKKRRIVSDPELTSH